MKKVLKIIIEILHLIFWLAFIAIMYFTNKKMGMARYMVYLGRKIKNASIFSVPVVSLICLLLVLLSIFFIAFTLYKKYIRNKGVLAETILLFIYAVFTGIYFFVFNIDKRRDYYACLIVLRILLIRQILSLALAFWGTDGKEK